MPAEPSTKATAWAIFDRIVADAAPGGVHTNPWVRIDGALTYAPDFRVLRRLLGVPLYLDAPSTTGVPALALDVWLSYELRRAGFDPQAVWPRATEPRIMPGAIANLLDALPVRERQLIETRLRRSMKGVSGSSASVLGKHYMKQVDVVMSDWDTGPELLISTKRMDSSFGKNAANRVEESYGDAKNLRLRHPLAALGFVYGLRSTILTSEPDKAEWLIDLLAKLGTEDDAYHAVALIMIDHDAEPSDEIEEADSIETADPDTLFEIVDVATAAVDEAVAALPDIAIRHDTVPPELQPARFLATMVKRVIDTTPVTRHREARRRLREA
ncbi:hypothetical protein MMAG44476_09522 [Mycolicibacterium mageritense DSM 44476 = CIP 104973]|uniref:Restriction endonuclease n=1 Tax=Mycolicibacterium mageritense TaxID=53462 RepID=A0ABN5YHG8_MYCME|nr:hypothetical protein [Mycolicibacterium mageritense]MCC9184011.1 hypothetical protein [Mycolicibacterium mageritense]TXI51845.1 MAG: hypothetical protein E6Q55_38085 [Mycolicibacterium mageritense]BBX36961.1 hypothetical protein MMAGJ_62430 [Mycolicibacterium mageritense]CDO26591.1 hypothetical protein BN978_07147 [Mycolicibacterium mageritense DSM 44476 = CIP 104973]